MRLLTFHDHQKPYAGQAGDNDDEITVPIAVGSQQCGVDLADLVVGGVHRTEEKTSVPRSRPADCTPRASV